MKNYITAILLLVLFSFSFSSQSLAFEKLQKKDQLTEIDSFPVPKNIPNLLFYIQRDPNTNTICYNVNLAANGEADKENPIDIYWIRYPEGGGRKELNYFQRKFAYGINSKSLGNGEFELRSVAYNKLPIYLRKDDKNKYRVYTKINNKDCVLNRVFIRIDGGSFWHPNVLYIEVKGKEVGTGKTITQRIIPK
jgi:hypothetical protein